MTDEIAALRTARSMTRTGMARLLREANGLSLNELATDVGIAPSTLSRWERQERRPQGPAAIRYGKRLTEFAEAPRA